MRCKCSIDLQKLGTRPIKPRWMPKYFILPPHLFSLLSLKKYVALLLAYAYPIHPARAYKRVTVCGGENLPLVVYKTCPTEGGDSTDPIGARFRKLLFQPHHSRFTRLIHNINNSTTPPTTVTTSMTTIIIAYATQNGSPPSYSKRLQ